MYLGEVSVLSREQLSDDVFRITVERPENMGAIGPGQFIMITANAYLLKRPISVSGITDNRIEFTIRIVGKGTQEIVKLEKLEIMGPLGNGFEMKSHKNILIVGGGIGVAPLLPVARNYTKDGIKTHVSLGFREGPIMDTEFDEYSSSLHIASELLPGYFNGYATSQAETILQNESVDMIFACGPKAMMKEVVKLSNMYSVPAQLLLEEKMACGIGACLGCTCKTKEGAFGFKHSKVCKDGPMFWADEVIFDEN